MAFVLQHVQQNKLITDRDYKALKSLTPNTDQSSGELLDKLRDKGEDTCQKFIGLLKQQCMLDQYPRLRDVFSDQPAHLRQEWIILWSMHSEQVGVLMPFLISDWRETGRIQTSEDEEDLQEDGDEKVWRDDEIRELQLAPPPAQTKRSISSTDPAEVREKLKSSFKEKFKCIYEGTSEEGEHTFLNQIFTELYIVDGFTGEVCRDHEVMQMEEPSTTAATGQTLIKCNNIFKIQSEKHTPVRSVLTLGIAGIGKTVSVQKFVMNWAEGTANQDVDFIFVLPFRELNLLKDDQFSLPELLLYFHPELEELKEAHIYQRSKLLFIFDGLDENQIPLELERSKKLSDITIKSPINLLITNLIKGELLPSALIWITSRPAAASQINRKYIHRVTEIKGFSDIQKEEYLRRRIRDEDKVQRILSHLKKSRSLHIMCHIPVFCRITATVLQKMLKECEEVKSEKVITAPTTLTEMYLRFLLIQTNQMKERHTGNDGCPLLKLGRLAFSQLEKGNIVFYEKDLLNCDLDVKQAVMDSGIFTQILKNEGKVFSFMHLSFQEFLAALYVFLMFTNEKINVLQNKVTQPLRAFLKLLTNTMHDLHKTAIDEALQSTNGHLDLFLRFLLGLSLEINQKLLKTLLPDTEIRPESVNRTVDYIKKKLNRNISSERSINLLYCLSEMKDDSISSEIQKLLTSGNLSVKKLSSAQWSALVFVLLMSEETQEKFDLKKYRASQEGLERLLPVVKNTRRALLRGCKLTEQCCEAVASVLQSVNCPLRELDLSNNDLQDSGVKFLCVGMKKPHCKLEILRLSGCLVTEEGCSSLASALSSNPSHLRKLDLSYNHPGDSGVRLLSARMDDPYYQLDTLNMDNGGKSRIKPGLRKYVCELTMDPDTAHGRLSLSEGNRKATWREIQSYPDHPERFDHWPQVVCREGLTGRCYWETEWNGISVMAVTYKGIGRKGKGDDGRYTLNEKSWGLWCFDSKYAARHNNQSTDIPAPPSPTHRVGVYLDWPSGTLSFYSVSSDTHTLTHLHTFHCTFTEPLYAGFGFGLILADAGYGAFARIHNLIFQQDSHVDGKGLYVNERYLRVDRGGVFQGIQSVE
ncbi:NACHT, LRR and PYD domains-containing protein 12-like [Chanos chanos]|uniref:NACHT, LRR and PYD domains-containing protein 12-like n=1 Tax=Chanos chanos TaxID=29144 RepID=A0A6J2VWL4_CHACN|nr:NACHT, LRR and PYD domains-containing protein 12-like [Chanos chanos]